MLKKHQNWIALLVTFTFAWLLHVNAMPLAASDKTEAGPACVEQAPGFFEQLGPEWNRPAKLKVKTVLIIVGVFLLLSIIWVFFRGIGHEAAPGEGKSAADSRRSLIRLDLT